MPYLFSFIYLCCRLPWHMLRYQGPVHTSLFCRVEFNLIKCGRNATVDSDVALVSNLVQNYYCRVCRSAENVLNVEYSICAVENLWY